MKNVLLVSLVFVLLSACGASKTPPPADSPPIERRAQQDGPMETVEAWIASNAPQGDVATLLSSWGTPVVERMHRDGAQVRRVLVTEADAEEAVLVTVVKSGRQWNVTQAEIIDGEYLWPEL